MTYNILGANKMLITNMVDSIKNSNKLIKKLKKLKTGKLSKLKKLSEF